MSIEVGNKVRLVSIPTIFGVVTEVRNVGGDRYIYALEANGEDFNGFESTFEKPDFSDIKIAEDDTMRFSAEFLTNDEYKNMRSLTSEFVSLKAWMDDALYDHPRETE